MASTRLRKAFKYPDSDSEADETARLELDDQEQESLIQALHAQNDRHNARYKLMLSILPIACMVSYVPLLIFTSTAMVNRLLAMLSVGSLLSTWSSTRQILSRSLNDTGKDSFQELGLGAALKRNQRKVNTLLCVALAAVLWFQEDTPGPADASTHFYLLAPGVVLLVTWVAETTMMSVDIESLENLKYEFKGA